ncbi:PRTRC system protein E [Pelobacter propionicus]|uniref:ParB-related ThiF-related cassette protein E domain-containing protein n=1 Tax=Pelobacter propionicus (strain DSM 2379 / NBRC 103807 / OttBd1) TaxID=338966 RepID=A0R7U4_PELPD|nr:PRTRC system protein E [Pelobacter propionicus]ABL01409.1 hypothetical protein Ppro_3821 [Pelobacter propionicus DSM 2379]
MFSAIHRLATQADLALNISASGDSLRVVVIPKPKSGETHSALITPLILEATPEELNEQFAGILVQYSSKRKSLVETLEETTAYLDAAMKEAKDKATKAATEKPTPAQQVKPAMAGNQPTKASNQPDDLQLF